MKHIAIILAGGIGNRVGGSMPKQFLPLADSRSIIEHAIDAFDAASFIDEIAIVMHPDYMDMADKLCQTNSWKKVKHIIPGGNERWESSYNAIKEYATSLSPSATATSPFIWLHDAARPFVSERIFSDIAAALESYQAVTVAVPVTDTLYRMHPDAAELAEIPSRSLYMRAQTPQAFRLDIILKAYQRALSSGSIVATDDCCILHKYMPEIPIHIVQGDESNRKITFKEDL